MIPIKKASASFDSSWDFCEQQTFISYFLGLPKGHTAKTLKGTIVHKVLELLAQSKFNLDNGQKVIRDKDIFGENVEYPIDMKTWITPSKLTTAEIDKINQSRKDKKTYKDPCLLQAGHVRLGAKYVEELISLTYHWFINKYDTIIWSKQDELDVNNWVWMILDGKSYDPRTKKIVATEQYFDIPILKEWATYQYGDEMGQFSIRGIIDLVIDVGDGVYEIVDYKTGQRLDWATGKTKDLIALQKDRQLMLYYYAARHVYKDIKDVMLTMLFVRDGGPFTVCFDNKTIIAVDNHLKQRFKQVQNTTLPKLHDPSYRSFKCKYLCEYYKMQVGEQNFCKYIHEQIKSKGISQVIKDFIKEKEEIVNENESN